MSTLSNERMKQTVGENKSIKTISSVALDGMMVHPIPGYRKEAMMKPSAMIASPHIIDYYYVQPANPVPSTVFTASSTQVDFILRAGSGFKIKAPVLSVQASETGGSASVTMTKLTDSFLQLQVLVNGGSDIFQTMNAPEIFQNTQWMTQEKWSTIAPLMGTTASWGAPTAISAGASKVFMLPLIGTWFDFVEPYLQCTKADIVLRFSFRASVSAGSGVLAGSNMQVIFEQDHGTEEDNKALIAMHSKYVMRSFYFNTQWVNGSTTFTANTTTNINLQSVTGKAVFMTFALRAGNTATSEG